MAIEIEAVSAALFMVLKQPKGNKSDIHNVPSSAGRIGISSHRCKFYLVIEGRSLAF
jgi:hypothetical protein